MSIHINMLDFLRMADFGSITLGMTRQQLQELLGDPPDWFVSGRKKGFWRSPIWRYGSIEFYFVAETNLMNMIFSDHFPLVGCDTLHLDPWLLSQYLPFEDAVKLLNQANLTYQIRTEPHTDSTQLVFESGAILNFHAPDYRPPYEDGPLELTGFSLKSDS